MTRGRTLRIAAWIGMSLLAMLGFARAEMANSNLQDEIRTRTREDCIANNRQVENTQESIVTAIEEIGVATETPPDEMATIIAGVNRRLDETLPPRECE